MVMQHLVRIKSIKYLFSLKVKFSTFVFLVNLLDSIVTPTANTPILIIVYNFKWKLYIV